MNILTEREFFQETTLDMDELNAWKEANIIRPIETFGGRFIFVRKQINFASKIKQLLQHGLNLQQISQYVENEDVDIEQVLNSQQIEERSIEFFQSLSYDEIIRRCQEERIIGFRRMTREEMEICLAYPERREELASVVRERNRRRSRQQEQSRITTAPTPSNVPENIANLTYSELVQMAKDARIRNFRRMTKEELILALTGTEEEVRRLIEEVRERTRQRYGSGATISRSQSLQTVEETTIGSTVVENNFFEIPEENEDVEEVVDNSVSEQPVDFPYTLEELQNMNSKQLAVVVRDHVEGLKYFRRMTKEELITCIFEPERREEMMQNALERYERYRGRRYGRN